MRHRKSSVPVVEAPVKVVAPDGDAEEPALSPPMSGKQTKKVMNELLVDGWPIRRRVMFLSLLFCAGNVQYLLIFGEDTSLNKEIATTLLWAAAAIIGSYVFGAVWDDMNRRDTMLEYDTTYGKVIPPLEGD